MAGEWILKEPPWWGGRASNELHGKSLSLTIWYRGESGYWEKSLKEVSRKEMQKDNIASNRLMHMANMRKFVT